MRDGRTRKRQTTGRSGGIRDFLAGHEARIVVVAGGASGHVHRLDRERTTLGRGPGVDLAFDDREMSRQHVVVEFSGEGFRIQDLGSTNGIVLNGKRVQAADIRHGDRFEIGSHVLQFVIEEREATPDTYELTPEA